MHGKGVYYWKDGRKYEGEYKYDKKHGLGTYTWADGRKYTGEWVNSKRHGKGKIISIDGSEREGVWEDDKRVPERGDTLTQGGPTRTTFSHVI